MERAHRRAFWRGMRDGAPFVLVIAPFGLLFGVVAREAGWDMAEILAMSVVVIAGASQFTALQLMEEHAPTLIVILTATAVNLRHAMYSASMAVHVGSVPVWKRALIAYFLVDQTYGTAMARYAREPALGAAEKAAYFFGGGALHLSVVVRVLGDRGAGRGGDPGGARARFRGADHVHRAVRAGAARPAERRGGRGGGDRGAGVRGAALRRGAADRRGARDADGGRGRTGAGAAAMSEIWAVILGLGGLTFLIRFSFLGLAGRRALPRWATRLLRYVPVSVLPALVAPLTVWPEATGGASEPARLIAAGFALGVGAATRNVLGSIVAGMAALYLGLWLRG